MFHSTKQSVLFPELLSKPIHFYFDEPNSTSDGGALLLKSVDTGLGLTASLARCMVDPREAGKIQHQLADIIRQRVFGLCCDYSCDMGPTDGHVLGLSRGRGYVSKVGQLPGAYFFGSDKLEGKCYTKRLGYF